MCLGLALCPGRALHIGLIGGDEQACLDFARQEAARLTVEKINCLFPPEAEEIKNLFARNGYEFLKTHLIVMETNLEY